MSKKVKKMSKKVKKMIKKDAKINKSHLILIKTSGLQRCVLQ